MNALRSPIGTRSATKRLSNNTAAEETSSKATSTGNTKDNLFSKEEMVQNDKTDSEVSLKIKKKKSTDVVKERLVQNNSKGPSIEEDGFKTAVTEEDAKSSKNQKDNEGRGKRRSKAVCNETDDSVATNDTVEQNLSKKQTKVMVKTQSKAMQKRSEPTDQKALLNARTSAVKKKTAKSSI
jgi:hypothetical protein